MALAWVPRHLSLQLASRDLDSSQPWLDSSRPVRTVDGLITGWHAASASHLMLLESVAGTELVTRAYNAAAGAGYLWHEFGDSCLLLP